MIVVVIVCVVVIVALSVATMRSRGRVDSLGTLVRETTEERDRAHADAESAAGQAERAVVERDDALERVSRSRRDAAEVANRLSEEVAARRRIEAELATAAAEIEAVRAAGPSGAAETLWALSLRQSEHLWRLSVAVDPDAPSPIAEAKDRFRAAVEIEVDAAREESGADVDLEWIGSGAASPERAVVALALVRDLVAALGTTAASTTIAIQCGEDAIEIAVTAIDQDDDAVPVPIPEGLETEPGRALIS